MGVSLKVCADCGHKKMIGRSKSRCKSCRHADPSKFVNRPVGTAPRKRNKKVRLAAPMASLTTGPFKDWRIDYLPKCVCPQNERYSVINLGTKQRNFVLKAYGYKKYSDYLRSRLWATIRAKVLSGAYCSCGCGQTANQVHHKAYTEANLMGADLRGLVAISRDCHYEIEFSEGRKVSLGEANRELKERRRKIQ